MAARKPDIVYIHNPYDEFNYVTSVDPHYYSHELKKHTGMLVFVHYAVITIRDNKNWENIASINLPAYHYSDRIIAQSEQMRKGLIDVGVPKERILTLGTPKLDYVLNHTKGECPSNWKAKLQGRTVFLVNSSLTDLLGHNQQWLLSLKNLFMAILEHKDCAVIWRPHPLMETTIESMRPSLKLFYQDMKRELLRQEHFIFDQNVSYLPAFDASHALISDHSSVFIMYGATGKPVLLMTGKKAEKKRLKYLYVDFFDFYFMQDGYGIEEFIRMVKSGQDTRREKRLSALRASLNNMDGTAGKKIHETILESMRETRRGDIVSL